MTWSLFCQKRLFFSLHDVVQKLESFLFYLTFINVFLENYVTNQFFWLKNSLLKIFQFRKRKCVICNFCYITSQKFLYGPLQFTNRAKKMYWLFCHKELCPLSKVFVLINFDKLHCIRITNSFVYMHTYHTLEYVLLLWIIRQTLTHIPTYSLKVNIRMKFCTVPEITSKWNVKMDVCTTRVDAIPKLKFEVS